MRTTVSTAKDHSSKTDQGGSTLGVTDGRISSQTAMRNAAADRLSQLKSVASDSPQIKQLRGRQQSMQTKVRPQIQAPVPHSPVIQGYFAVNSGGGGYVPAVGTTFESQQKVNGIATRTQKTIGALNTTQTQEQEYQGGNFVNQGGPVVTPGTPDIHVSANAEMAIENTAAEARNYFATANSLAASNNALTQTGSAVRLHATGQTTTVPTNPDPNNYDATPKALSKIQVDPNIDPQANLGDFFGTAECNNFVKKIIGSAERVAVVGTGVNELELDAPTESEPFNAIADYVSSTPQGNQTPANLDQHVVANQVDQNAQVNYNNLNKAHVDPSLGINEHASPEVGEGYVIRPLKDDIDNERQGQAQVANQFSNNGGNDEYLNELTALRNTNQQLDVKLQGLSLKAQSLKHIWIYHYAGVVAKDGGDTITLENYNRGQEKKWIINDAFDDLFLAQQDFRDFVWQTTPTLKAQDHIQQRDLINQMQARGVVLNGALQVLYDTARDTANANIGPINSMIHFKMYGSEVGQSFHEKWQPSTANQITLRIRQSLDGTRATKLNLANNLNVALQAAFNQACPNQLVAHRLNVLDTDLQNDVGLCIADINNATSIQEIEDACHAINQLKNGIEAELAFCLETLLPNVQAQAPLATLIQQIANEIANNGIGYRVRGRDEARTLKRSLQALHACATAVNQIANL